MKHAVRVVDFNKDEIGYVLWCGIEMQGLPPGTSLEVLTRTAQVRHANIHVDCQDCIAAMTGGLLAGTLRPNMLFEWVPDA